MENVLNNLLTEIKGNIAHDLKQYPYRNGELLKLVLNAYNTYQKEERDSVDYIFDINKPEDLKCCIEGGMSEKEVTWLCEQSQVNTTPFFYFGVNYKKPKPIADYNTLVANLISELDNILPCILAYPYIFNMFIELYKVCLTDNIINSQLVP